MRTTQRSIRRWWQAVHRRLRSWELETPTARAGEQSLVDEAFLRRLERLVILARNMSSTGLIGEHRSRRRATSFEFADYRRYVAGDDLRRIDWNAYGRLEGLFLKLTEAKEDLPIHLLLDCSRSMNWGSPNKFVYAKQLVAALGYLALSRFDAVTVATFGERLYDRFPMVRGKHQALSLLSFLDNLAVGEHTDLGSSMMAYCSTNRRRGLAILVSDLHTRDGHEPGLIQLLQSGLEPHVLHLVDPQELAPRVKGEAEIFDLESGEVVELLVGPEVIRQYQERFDSWCGDVKAFCHQRDISYLRVDTSIPLEQLILKDMRQARVVR
ncbi:MAG: DUF58 domain-containing protein [Chloroflexi bacterium]|nr:DUF58 domain-containing protein [Chloroflexota bacterium]